MKNKLCLFSIFLLILGVSLLAFSQDKDVGKKDLIAWWKLEKVQDGKITDEVTKKDDLITGNYKQVKGILGKALRFDGFTTL
ncbi:MAG: hypothetical protein RBR88_03125, partial [Candidatus Saccharicenans sp.]|nr:hypothetical protein [Candidatus Saccharicenans sp.]